MSRNVCAGVLLVLVAPTGGAAEDDSSATAERLKTPAMTIQQPAAGRRVKVVTVEYAGTEVHHSLYLPEDWTPDRRWPVLVEYTGNEWKASGSSGKVGDANLGYGLSGGQGFIWVVLPCVAKDRQQNTVRWWGDLTATLDYCKLNVPRICQEYSGDPRQVVLCGFSRGAIAANFLGLADDEISGLWKGFVTHDHYDGVFAVAGAASAPERLRRLNGRPQLICSALGTRPTRQYLQLHIPLDHIKFLDVPVDQLFRIPADGVVHPHTDRWMQIDSPYRRQARRWLQQLVSP